MILIDKESIVITGDAIKIDGEIYIKADDVNRCLEKAAAAYDPDKVVRVLEELKNINEDGSDAFCPDKDGECRYIFNDGVSCSDCAIDYAIEIVKKGGAE